MVASKIRQFFKVFVTCVLWFSILVKRSPFTEADKSIQAGSSLSGKQTLISDGEIFELGFFTPAPLHKFYLGIWYKKFSEKHSLKTVVWVANRDNPILDATSELRLLDSGELALFGESTQFPLWSTNSPSTSPNSTEAVLLDSGNLILRDKFNPNNVIWQSFDHPTDTWLPGGSLGLNTITGIERSLTSWIASVDPAHGVFSFGVNSSGNIEAIELQMWWKKSVLYWNGRFAPKFKSFSNSHFYFVQNESGSCLTYSVTNSTRLSRIVLDYSGQIKELLWNELQNDWTMVWRQPMNPCDVFSSCGDFSICDNGCRCLNGFDAENLENWISGNRTGGCVRRTPLQCISKGEEDGFLLLDGIAKFPINSKILEVKSIEECRFNCLNKCICNAYAYDNGCRVWLGNLLNTQQHNGGNKTLYIRLPKLQLVYQEEKGKEVLISTKQRRQLQIIGIVNGVLLFLLSSVFVLYLLHRKFKIRKGGKISVKHDLLQYDSCKESIEKFCSGVKEEYYLPLFSFASVVETTNDFSPENLLGRGGFGPVYKGVLLNGKAVAVKRLSRTSIQGHQEFKNEIKLISELQHVNLAKLVGCCIEEEEKILVYEYMNNKSLDFFLFDPSNEVPLSWKRRKDIVEGISQGLLYLHKYSRLKIIHRDLEASNILLDDEMNPKISDFGMARIYAGNESNINTKRVVGTFGYMPPEYAVEGAFSVKSDVFSYGVLLLEIISGKKATSFTQHDHYPNLLAYAFEMWRQGKFYEMMDPNIGDKPPIRELIRHINIALLCVEERASDRPIMSYIIYMLSNESVDLPKPIKPAFISATNEIEGNTSPRGLKQCSTNDVTISDITAR